MSGREFVREKERLSGRDCLRERFSEVGIVRERDCPGERLSQRERLSQKERLSETELDEIFFVLSQYFINFNIIFAIQRL